MVYLSLSQCPTASPETRDEDIELIRRVGYLAIDPYRLWGGVGSLAAIRALADMLGGTVDPVGWAYPFYIRDITVSDAELSIVLDVLHGDYRDMIPISQLMQKVQPSI